MDPKLLRELLAELKEARVRRAVFGKGVLVEIELYEGGPAPSASGMPSVLRGTIRDTRTGEPVDLDDGAPELAQATVDDEIARANFTKADKAS